MTWKQFYDSLEQAEYKNVYCLYGPEEYIKKSAFAALQKKLLPEGLEPLNETVLENASAQQIIEAAETLPMMAERRIVLVKDWAPLLSAKAKNGSADTEQLLKWLPNAPDSCSLVFYVHGAPDGRTKAMQALTKQAACVQFELLADDALAKWINAQLKPMGKHMSPKAIHQLVFMAGRELTRLSGELGKLMAYAGDRESITEQDVTQLVTPTLECTVFQLIDQLMAGNQMGAQQLFKTMLESGENRIGILFMLTRQLRNLTHIKQLSGQGMRLNEIEKKLGLSHFVASSAERQAKRFSLDGLEKGYRACLDAEFDIKSGKVRDVLAVDHLLLALGQMK
ncbi:DNA polymerase III subunit delta [Eubacteriales bacterium OttesenSCG-928-N13]|nr:DNA polymerase III subunit delta [Eubacteriales bacterium OttesenSCG-928-N13]